MNNKFTFLLFVAFAVVSCNNEKPVEFSSESFTEKELDMCKDDSCPEITINYVLAFGNEAISEKINKKINDFILKSLLVSDDTIPTAKNIDEAAADFVKVYQEDKAQFPDMAGVYEAEISVNEIYSSPELLCFEMRQYKYTGGAHGYETKFFMNIDPKTGDELTKKDLFKNIKDFKTFAEEKFRSQQQIPAGESINSTGYWFENEKFYLPETVGFVQDSIIFVYNQYDIASFAEGQIELKIATEKAAPYLKIE